MTGSIALRRAELERMLRRFIHRAANRERLGFAPVPGDIGGIRACQSELDALDAIAREIDAMENEVANDG